MSQLISLHRILISLGTNIDKEQHTRAGLTALEQTYVDLSISSVYESEAVGFAGSNFYNLVVQAFTDKTVAQVCDELKTIENNNGRVRGGKKFSPRTLDLDLLTYDEVVISDPVELPRAEILNNAFVLLPMAELVPELVHPVVGKTYQQLWSEYPKDKQLLWTIPFNY